MAWYEMHTHCLDQQKQHGELSTSLGKCIEANVRVEVLLPDINFISITGAFAAISLRDSHTFINKNTNCFCIMQSGSHRTIHLAIYIISKRFEL